MAEDREKPDRFKAQMPQIPGVPVHPAGASGNPLWALLRAKTLGPAAVLIVLGSLGVWFYLHAPRASAPAPPAGTPTAGAAAEVAPATPPAAAGSAPSGPVVVATLEELSQPWSAKPFVFHKRLGSEAVAAMIIRLPGPAKNISSYWAFSLEEPFGRCQLEFETDRAKLSDKYSYPAAHPMVVDPCTGTLFDPLKLGTLPDGAWTRGEIVHGSGFRPPFSIQLELRGNQLIATQIE